MDKRNLFRLNKIMNIQPIFEIPFQCLQMLGLGGNNIIWDETSKNKYFNLFKRD